MVKANGQDDEFPEITVGNGIGGEGDDILEEDVYTVLDDAAREELDELVGMPVVGIDVWEESLSDAEDEEPVAAAERVFFDTDLMFEDSLALELYAAAVYPDPEGDPVTGIDEITRVLEQLADKNLQLLDFDQADEEGGLALAFGKDDKVEIVVTASAWLVSEWEEGEPEEDETV